GRERLLGSGAVVGLVGGAADRRRGVCVVERAQGLHKPSGAAFVFVARRLRAERVAMLFGARVGDVRTFEAPGLPDLQLGPLDDRHALALLLGRGRSIAPVVRRRLLQAAAGNPLALLELPIALSDAQRAGRELLPAPIPLSARFKASCAARIERLPKLTRGLLLVAAADDTGELATVLRAGAELGASAEALEPAEFAGLVHVTPTKITFRHPL